MKQKKIIDNFYRHKMKREASSFAFQKNLLIYKYSFRSLIFSRIVIVFLLFFKENICF